MVIPQEYFLNQDPFFIAQDLLGKKLVSHLGQQYTSGIIVETEIYLAPEDDASHAFNYKRTPRNESMYSSGGIIYIYINYGIHHMLNISVGPKDDPIAILIRALEPIEGLDIMRKRRGVDEVRRLTSGPGNLCKALGIDKSIDGRPLMPETDLYLESTNANGISDIRTSRRVGLRKSLHFYDRPWRFYCGDSHFVSRLV